MRRKPSVPAPDTIEAQLWLVLDAGGIAAWEKPCPAGAMVWQARSDPDLAAALESPLRFWLEALDGGGFETGPTPSDEAFHPERVRHREFQVAGMAGTARWVEVRARRLDDGGERRWVGIATDITGRRRCEFPAAVAHEIRNPVAALVASAQLLRRHGRDRPDLLETIPQRIERQARYLSRLVGDLSDWARICGDRAEIVREILELGTIINEAGRRCRPLLEEQGQGISVDLPEKPLYARGDSARLRDAVGKLLLHAAKFTPKGGSIHLSLSAGQRRATILIRDEGIGMEGAEMERIFEPFFQLAPPLHPGQSGLSLGLAAAKFWIERQGGEITAWSAGKGRGSEFVIHLPLAGEETSAASGLRGPAPGT